jgi:hypothetical protein
VTRAYLGLGALEALYLVAGLGLLAGFGHVRSAGSGLRLAGLGALRRRWPGLVALLAAPVLAAIPWRAWLAVHDVPLTPDYRLADALDAGRLVDRADRLDVAIRQLPAYLGGGDDWLFVLPVALVAAALIARRAPALAVLLAGTPLVALAGLVLVYWIGFLPVHQYVATSAERVVLSPILFACALLPLALAQLLPESPG